MKVKRPKMIVGWREWVSFPDLGIPAIKAKIDTGAKTTALHVFSEEPFLKNGEQWIRFDVHPLQGRNDVSIPCEAPLVDRRMVTSSVGSSQRRFVISTSLEVAGRRWPVEITLTNRDHMKYRMLLARSAMRGNLLVDPQLSFQAGKPAVRSLYENLEFK